MSINIWISSVCLGEQSLSYLLYTVESLLHLSKHFTIYISIYTDNDLTSLYSVLNRGDKPYYVTLRDQPYRQFEHIKLLTQEVSNVLNDDDWIVFLDDDDLMLYNSLDLLDDKISGYIGYQYIPVIEHSDKSQQVIEDSYDVTIDNVYDFIIKNEDVMVKADDFSGTAVRFRYLKKYMGYRVGIKMRIMEDVRFMNYVERLPSVIYQHKMVKLTQPFVFHRIKRHKSLWRQQLGL